MLFYYSAEKIQFPKVGNVGKEFCDTNNRVQTGFSENIIFIANSMEFNNFMLYVVARQHYMSANHQLTSFLYNLSL